MSANLRVAVIGVGHLGQHHARILAAMEGVNLVGVVDVRPERAQEIAAKYGTTPFTDARELHDRVDAVSIAVPTGMHVEVALPFLEQRTAVLVEKPLAASLDEADRLIAAADRRGSVLAAGHTERFNPAVEAARSLIVNPRFIEVHRLGTFPERSLDIDVIFDLMIHDLDVLLSIVPSEIASVASVATRSSGHSATLSNPAPRSRSNAARSVRPSRSASGTRSASEKPEMTRSAAIAFTVCTALIAASSDSGAPVRRTSLAAGGTSVNGRSNGQLATRTNVTRVPWTSRRA